MVTSTKRHASRPRHGIAVILVLAALSITMALAFALSRCSLSTYKVSANASTSLQARQAAAAAAALALEKLGKDPNWLPEPNPMTGTLPSGETYRVEVQPGDEPRTLDVTAAAQVIDPQDHHVLAEQSLKIKLAKQRLDNFPASAITAYAAKISDTDGPPVYVAAGSSIVGDIRSRGPVVFQQGFTLLGHVYQLPNVLSCRTRLSDYEQYRTVWGGRYAAQRLASRCGIQSESGLRVKDVVLGPTPTNPMGVYYHEGNVALEDHVILNGTLMVKGNIEIRGEDVQLASVCAAHNPESGEMIQTCFPVLVAQGSIVFSDEARQVSITGLMLASRYIRREGGSDTEPDDDEVMTYQNVLSHTSGTDVLSVDLAIILTAFATVNSSGVSTVTDDATSSGTSTTSGTGSTTDGTLSATSVTTTVTTTTDGLSGSTGDLTTPAIVIRGAVMAKRVNLRNAEDHPFQLVFVADTTDVIDAPGFFTWKVVDWTDSR